MINILIALCAGAAITLVLFLPGLLGIGESIVPGVFVALLAYYGLARMTFKKVEKIFTNAGKHLQTQPPRFELAVQALESALPYAKQQIGVQSQVSSQIGVIWFLKQDFKKAVPFLEKSLGFGHWLGSAMLAVIYYKRKNQEKLRETIDIVVKRGKKQSLAWNLCAYLLVQVGDRDAAQQLLVRGLKKTKDDPKVKEALLAVQNGKKIKMKSYKEQWYQFHLERPPAQYQQQMMPMRVGKIARRGRW